MDENVAPVPGHAPMTAIRACDEIGMRSGFTGCCLVASNPARTMWDFLANPNWFRYGLCILMSFSASRDVALHLLETGGSTIISASRHDWTLGYRFPGDNCMQRNKMEDKNSDTVES